MNDTRELCPVMFHSNVPNSSSLESLPQTLSSKDLTKTLFPDLTHIKMVDIGSAQTRWVKAFAQTLVGIRCEAYELEEKTFSRVHLSEGAQCFRFEEEGLSGTKPTVYSSLLEQHRDATDVAKDEKYTGRFDLACMNAPLLRQEYALEAAHLLRVGGRVLLRFAAFDERDTRKAHLEFFERVGFSIAQLSYIPWDYPDTSLVKGSPLYCGTLVTLPPLY